MADPTKYVTGYSFTAYQAVNPARPLPAPQVDVELANIQTSLGQTIDALAQVRRSDGAIKNASVTLDSLNETVFQGFAGLTANLIIPSDDWVAGKFYLKGSIVAINGGSAMAKAAHTSGATYAADFAAGLWQTLATKGASGGGTGDLVAANNGSDFPSKSTVRANLQLLGMATQAPSAVTITGGTITGITDLAIADGGTGASNAPAALVNLGINATAAELNANQGVSSIGTAVIRAISTLAARSAIGAQPTGQQGAGIGQFVQISAATGAALYLPAGGTWLFYWQGENTSTGISAYQGAGTQAGGSLVASATAGYQFLGWAWRIA